MSMQWSVHLFETIYIYIHIISKPFNVRIFVSTTTAKSYKNTTKK